MTKQGAYEERLNQYNQLADGAELRDVEIAKNSSVPGRFAPNLRQIG
jgi:hypothetical protein